MNGAAGSAAPFTYSTAEVGLTRPDSLARTEGYTAVTRLHAFRPYLNDLRSHPSASWWHRGVRGTGSSSSGPCGAAWRAEHRDDATTRDVCPLAFLGSSLEGADGGAELVQVDRLDGG